MKLKSADIDEELSNGGRLQGFCTEAFSSVLTAFRNNFTERREVGASVCLTLDGATMVDLWGGMAEPVTRRPWARDTICIVHSSTKGAASLVANMLVERGKLALHDDVAVLWPDFAQNGKSGTSLAMMLSHAASVPALRDAVKPGGPCDWDYMVARVAAEPAWWPPGSRQGYHAMTFAWTIGQMVRLAAGHPLGEILRAEVAAPLGLDFWIGLPEEHESRVAPLIPPDPSELDRTTAFFRALSEPGTLPSLLSLNAGAVNYNSREVHAAEIASGNGITNARGLAGLYTPLANGGGNLVHADTIASMSRVIAATHQDAMLMRPMRFGLGFMRSTAEPRTGQGAIMGEHAFGHAGAGGSIGFADPQARLGFGYTMNRLGPLGLLNDRGQSLVDAAYRSLGWRYSHGGAWMQ